MDRMNRNEVVAQFPLSGIPEPPQGPRRASCCDVRPGQEVRYLGNIRRGPRYGAHGVITSTLRRRAVVNMGRAGTWHIPYYFLAVLSRAA